MHIGTVAGALWLASFMGHWALLVVLIFRRRYRKLPVFTMFISGELTRNVTLFFVYRLGSHHLYFVVYWTLNVVVDVVLQAGVVWELAKSILRPTGHWSRDVSGLLTRALVAGLSIAMVLTTLSTGSASTLIETVVMKGSFFTAVLMAETASGMLIVSVRSGLPWRGYSAKIALAFGLFSLLMVLFEVAHHVFGKAYSSETDQALFNLQTVAYLLCQGYWLVCLWRREPTRSSASDEAPEMAKLWARTLSARSLDTK